jgi:hypothetical protein
MHKNLMARTVAGAGQMASAALVASATQSDPARRDLDPTTAEGVR